MKYSSVAHQHKNNSTFRRFSRAYNKFYDAILNELTPNIFLELGISTGTNLMLWNDILKDSVKIGIELLNPSQSVESLTGDSFEKQLDECKEAVDNYLKYQLKVNNCFIFKNNNWYFDRDAFSIETVKEIINKHGKIDLIINDARHGIDVWKKLDVWKDALTDNGVIITEEIGCATRAQTNGDLINEDQINSAINEGWKMYNFNNIKTWNQSNCIIGYWSKNQLGLKEINEFRRV